MAAGKAVIATKVGGIPEFVVPSETGFLVEPGNVQALAEAIQYLLDDAERATQMGSRGRARAQGEFGISGVVRQHEQLYESCLIHE
ncbi:MAG: glycosyltransferase, partial [Nitrospira sp.]|nr:glycosyltransferase [Nitrospira sp.]